MTKLTIRNIQKSAEDIAIKIANTKVDLTQCDDEYIDFLEGYLDALEWVVKRGR